MYIYCMKYLMCEISCVWRRGEGGKREVRGRCEGEAVRRRRWSNNKNPILRIWGIKNFRAPKMHFWGPWGPKKIYSPYPKYGVLVIPHILSMGFLLLDQRRRLPPPPAHLPLPPSSCPYMLCNDKSYIDKLNTDMLFPIS